MLTSLKEEDNTVPPRARFASLPTRRSMAVCNVWAGVRNGSGFFAVEEGEHFFLGFFGERNNQQKRRSQRQPLGELRYKRGSRWEQDRRSTTFAGDTVVQRCPATLRPLPTIWAFFADLADTTAREIAVVGFELDQGEDGTAQGRVPLQKGR